MQADSAADSDSDSWRQNEEMIPVNRLTPVVLADTPEPATIIRTYTVKLLQPTGHVMHQQFNIQQLYVLPTLHLCVLYLSENKQRLVPLTA